MATAITSGEKPQTSRPAAKTANSKPAKAKAATPKPAPRKTAAAGTGKAHKAKAVTAPSTKPTAAKRATAPANRQSRDSSMTGKEHDNHVDRVWELAERIGIAMFVTWDGKQQRARPLAATIERDQGAIYFLTDINGEKDDQVSDFPMVSVSFADNKHNKYVAISGKATVSNDRQRIKDLWSPFARAWWDSPEDPAIRVIKVVAQDAELWDSPGRIVTTISMLAAAVTGRSPRIGENAKVVL